MKSTGLSKVDRFLNTEGHASFRLPRPFMTRKRESGTTSSGLLSTCGSVSSLAGSYDGSVSISTGMGLSNVTVTGIDDGVTPYLSAGMIVQNARSSSGFRNGTVNNLTRIVSVDSATQITVDNVNGTGSQEAMFVYAGNNLISEDPGNYFPGRASIPPPASGKLYSVAATSSTYLNYSDFTPGPSWNYNFTTTAGDANVNYEDLLVAEYTTGDGLGSNVRIMWMAFYTAGSLAARELSIKSWETGDVVFELSSRETSVAGPKQVQFVEIPMGGIFCRGGAVFQWGNGTSDSAPGTVCVGYQI